MARKTQVAVLVSGGGTNLQAILDAQLAGKITDGEVSLVVSNDPSAYALERAAKAGVESMVIPCMSKDIAVERAFEAELTRVLEERNIELIVLAGFLCILTEDFVKHFDHHIINVHPSLIPSFCGDGFYGLHVHEAALAKGVKVSGATVHFVNEITDGGEIILQKAVNVEEGDTPSTLQRRIMEQAEWVLLPQAVQVLSKKFREAKGE